MATLVDPYFIRDAMLEAELREGWTQWGPLDLANDYDFRHFKGAFDPGKDPSEKMKGKFWVHSGDESDLKFEPDDHGEDVVFWNIDSKQWETDDGRPMNAGGSSDIPELK